MCRRAGGRWMELARENERIVFIVFICFIFCFLPAAHLKKDAKPFVRLSWKTFRWFFSLTDWKRFQVYYFSPCRWGRFGVLFDCAHNVWITLLSCCPVHSTLSLYVFFGAGLTVPGARPQFQGHVKGTGSIISHLSHPHPSHTHITHTHTHPEQAVIHFFLWSFTQADAALELPNILKLLEFFIVASGKEGTVWLGGAQSS